MYRLKEKYKVMVVKYAMKTKLDINGVYTKDDWNSNGYKDTILEKI